MSKGKTPHERDRPSGAGRRRGRRAAPGGPVGGAQWLYGSHAVRAALGNPKRRLKRLVLSPEAAEKHGIRLESGAPTPETMERAALGALLPEGAVHQGLALLAEPLLQPSLAEIVAAAEAAEAAGSRPLVVVLDRVTDPQNLGAVLRSAAAFGAAAVLATKRHAPGESGALAKAASGALEQVPYLQEANLARALGRLKAAGFWALGLSDDAAENLAAADPGGRLALVLGAEGHGLRRLTRETCDLFARLPTRPPIATLNVSNAAAVALYELLGRARG